MNDPDVAWGQACALWFLAAVLAVVGLDWSVWVTAPAALFCIALPVIGWHRWQRRTQAILALRSAVRTHRGALVKNLRSAVKRNDYGVITSDNTEDAVADFLTSMDILLPPSLALATIEAELAAMGHADARTGFTPGDIPTKGHEFEHWVADALRQHGWTADVTRASGDQGVDVIARKSGMSLGIQCKRQSRPVGNKAVQEASAGRLHYGLAAAAVLSTARFTRSAQALALSADVHLLAPHDIPKLMDRLQRKTGAPDRTPASKHA